MSDQSYPLGDERGADGRGVDGSDADERGVDEPMIEGRGVEARSAEGLEDTLVNELDIIAEQPLPDRAASFARIHDRLQAELNGQ